MRGKIKDVLSTILELDVSAIDENSCSIDTVANWDSLQQIRIVLALEQEFGIEFDDDEISQLTDFKSIHSLIEKKVSLNSIN